MAIEIERNNPSSWFYTDFEDALFQEIHASGKLAKTLQKRNVAEQHLEQLVEEQTRIWDTLTKAQKKLFRPLSEDELQVAHKLVR